MSMRVTDTRALIAVFMGFFLSIFLPAIGLAQSPKDSKGDDVWAAFQNGGQLNQVSSNLPISWGPEKNIAWQTQLDGYGQSSPVLFQGRVYISTVNGDNKEALSIQALGVEDGKAIWTFQHANSSPEKNTVMVSRAAPTPVVDENGIIAFFEGGNLFALSHDGKLRWKRDLRQEFGLLKARHGLAASLEQDNECIYLWAERMEDPYVMAIEKSTGKTKWKKPGLGSTSWSSPRLVSVGEKQHLVLSAMGLIVGLDPGTGSRLWEFNQIAGNSSSTPVAIGKGAFLIGSNGGRGEIKTIPSCGVIQIENNDGAYSAAWRWAAPKASCSFGSPLAAKGMAYFVNRTGIVHCHDLKTGEKVFVERLPSGQIWATPLANMDSIYFFGKDGRTAVIEHGSVLKMKSENDLWKTEKKPSAGDSQNPAERFAGSVLYAAIAAENTLLIRRGEILYAIR
ncbi:MAG: PQQ-binding-like beta-propeller repeat protein [Planctomycetota bacterium]